MTYMEHIKQMSDEDFAYFLDFLQPEIELFMLAMERTLAGKGSRDCWRPGDDGTCQLNGTRRSMYIMLKKVYDEEMKRICNDINPSWRS